MKNHKKATTIKSTIASGKSLGTAINVENYEAGVLITPAEWSDANIGFKVSFVDDGTYVVLAVQDGTVANIAGIPTAESRAFKLPDEFFSAVSVKPFSKHKTGDTVTDENQAAARTLTFILY